MKDFNDIIKFTNQEFKIIMIIITLLTLGFLVNLFSGYSKWVLATENEEFFINSLTYPIDINKCSLEELMSLPKIGLETAKRIIEYRNKNNGFKSKSEIKLVGGIGEKTYEMIKEKIFVENDVQNDENLEVNEEKDNFEIVKIDINNASINEFKKIKGLGKAIGEKIIKYKEKNGRINSFNELKQIEGIGQKRLKKLQKYFVIY